jgi:uncharacterized protein YfbU (UPF0304 family)
VQFKLNSICGYSNCWFLSEKKELFDIMETKIGIKIEDIDLKFLNEFSEESNSEIYKRIYFFSNLLNSFKNLKSKFDLKIKFTK